MLWFLGKEFLYFMVDRKLKERKGPGTKHIPSNPQPPEVSKPLKRAQVDL